MISRTSLLLAAGAAAAVYASVLPARIADSDSQIPVAAATAALPVAGVALQQAVEPDQAPDEPRVRGRITAAVRHWLEVRLARTAVAADGMPREGEPVVPAAGPGTAVASPGGTSGSSRR
jgi:hypothetical protein